MVDMNSGDVVYMTSCEVVTPDGTMRLRFSPGRKHRFAFMFLGGEPRDGSAPIDPIKMLRAMGWVPDTENIDADETTPA